MMIGPQLIFNQIFSFENMGFFVTLEKNKAVCNLKIFRVGTGKNVGYHTGAALKKIETTFYFLMLHIQLQKLSGRT